MPTKNTVRIDLNHLRKLCKSISLIEPPCSVGDVFTPPSTGSSTRSSVGLGFSSTREGDRSAVEGVCDPLLEKQYATQTRKRDKILDKYRNGIDALSPEESLIFTLYYLQGLTQKQVAIKTNYCKSSITKHLSAIINKLK